MSCVCEDFVCIIYRATEFLQRNGDKFSGFGLAIHSTTVWQCMYSALGVLYFAVLQIYKDSGDRNNPYVGDNWSVEDLLTAFSHEVYLSRV